MSAHITTQCLDGVMIVTLARLDKKNALTQAMYRQLAEALKQAEADEAVRAVLLRGNDQCFSAGNDLHDFMSLPDVSRDGPILAFLTALAAFSKPLVAAVAGPAVGIGTTALLHCDLVVADAGSRFQLPFVALGLCPEAGSSALLAQRVGQAKARQWLLTGQPFDAAEALHHGLINEVVEGGVCERGLALARQLAALPAGAMQASKALLNKWSRAEIQACIEDEAAVFGRLLRGEECQAAVRAFFSRG
ncbi:enoyl-CoA hydratase-related protein [Gallaecimonas sp. GXIMD4217]|uniref:enoyl-CoA hydratase-related protein n=1 Tax=Gallaecimonas sp. GXIMD4217 TaxID=3131927 RepID=UPI00311B2524